MTIPPARQASDSITPAVAGSPRESLMNARSMFTKVLSGWAVDVLALRKRGWDRPCLRLCGTSAGAHPGVRKVRRAAGRRRAA
jgi:hypothetical protein